MASLPSIQLYPGDWLRDTVAGCSLAAQGLWLRMMFMAHDSERYGYLMQNGQPIPADSIARRCGCTTQEYLSLLDELDRAAVPSRTPEGIIFSRRMVRDAKARAAAAERQRSSRSRHASVTPASHRSSSSSSTSEETPLSPPKGGQKRKRSSRLSPEERQAAVYARLGNAGESAGKAGDA